MITISKKYKELNQIHHSECAKHGIPWGISNVTGHWLDRIVEIACENNVRSIFDYGSGHGVMSKRLKEKGFLIGEYDPGLPEKEGKPKGQFDMLISLDVLEHVESDYIMIALDEVAAYTRKVAFLTIATTQAKHILPGGVNAHQTIQTSDWWLHQLSVRFDKVQILLNSRSQLVVVVTKEQA